MQFLARWLIGFGRPERLVAFCCIALLLGPTANWAAEPTEVEARPPTLLGIERLTLTGRVQPHGMPTTWHFEYGPTKQYGQQTASEPLPPRLAAYYHETWDQGWNGWRTWDPRQRHFAEGGASAGYIRYQAIDRDDHNHDDGIGTVHLAKYMYPGPVTPIPSAFLAAGDPDFRDARVKVAVRGVDWQPHGTELMWWSQSQSNIEINPDDGTLHPNYLHANWCFTGANLTGLLRSGEWEQADYRLTNDPHAWSYCGNNPRRQDYQYWPLNNMQRHLNLDFFHMVVFVDPNDRPKGAIDFDEFEVAYRNYSLVVPFNGGKLLAAPPDSPDDAVVLTDGWRNGPGRMWSSGQNPSAPQDFVYEFAQPVMVNSVQLHQHTAWPSREVEVLVSTDGKDWRPLVSGVLPEKHAEGPNYAFLLQRKLNAAARQVKVRILSGYRPEHWGLGEIEIFGSGAEMQTDDDWYHVNCDSVPLQPGETYHFRLVTESAAGRATGPDQTFTMPSDARPHVIIGQTSRIGQDTAKVEGRINPLGHQTMFHFEYGTDESCSQKTEQRYGGRQLTPRSAFDTLTGLKPDTLYYVRLAASNEVGTATSDVATFRTK
ncbi:MAG: hypothetical protein AB7O62_19735 [Pirellulales bacterium]